MSEPPAKKNKSKSNDKRERIGHLEDKTLLYFRRASDQLKEGFEDDDEKAAFLDNVFKETAKEEIKLARNQTVSRIMEEMVGVAEKDHVEAFLKGFTEEYHLVCTDRFASHVTQALIAKCPEILGDEGTNHVDGEDSIKSASTFVTELFNVTYGNMREFVFDTYASHIIRALLLLLGGCDMQDGSLRSRLSQRDQNRRQPRQQPPQQQQQQSTPVTHCLNDTLKAKYRPLLEQFSEKCLSLGINDMVQNDVTSPVLQAILKALKCQKSPMADSACEKIMTESQPFGAKDGDSLSIPPTWNQSAGFCRLVEELLASSSKTRLKSIYKHHLKPRLQSLALSSSAPNFVLQRFLRSIRTPTLFALVVEDVFRNMEFFVVKSSQRAAIVAVAEKCIEFGTHQDEFVMALMRSLKCSTADTQRKLALLVADFKTYDVLFGDESKGGQNNNNENNVVQVRVSLHGSLLLQRLFSFTSPDAVFNSFMSLPPSQLAAFACDPSGCHVFDAILSSPSIDDVKLNKFVSRMKSSLVTMATSKCGSRVIDALWKRSAVKNKIEVAEALTKQLGRISGDRFGRFIARNLQLDSFALKKEQWVKNLQA